MSTTHKRLVHQWWNLIPNLQFVSILSSVCWYFAQAKFLWFYWTSMEGFQFWNTLFYASWLPEMRIRSLYCWEWILRLDSVHPPLLHHSPPGGTSEVGGRSLCLPRVGPADERLFAERMRLIQPTVHTVHSRAKKLNKKPINKIELSFFLFQLEGSADTTDGQRDILCFNVGGKR